MESSEASSSSNTSARGPVESRNALEFDWQSTKFNLQDRFEYIFENHLYCDVKLIVGPPNEAKKIPALKAVLMAGSSVFHAMFSEVWSPECSEVEVPDIQPDVFEEFLRFLYCDKVELTSEIVIEMLYVVKKYAVKALEIKCAEYLQSYLCPENAFTIFIEAKKFNEKGLVDACLEVICNNTFEAVNSEDFCNIDFEDFCSLLKRSDLTINEISLFKATVRWSEAACKRRRIPVHPRTQRLLLRNALTLIRFPLMSPNEFASTVVDSKLLLSDDVQSMLLWFIKDPKPAIKFSTTPRRSFFVAHRFTGEASGSYGSSYILVFQANHNISVLGIGLYGSTTESAELTVNLTFKSNSSGSRILSELSQTYRGPKKIFRVMLKKPVTLTANVNYRFDVTISGNCSFYGTNGVQTFTVNLPSDKKVQFTMSSSYTYYEGQVPEILFCL